ncbi:DUF3137 domain-containing protein [Candidatus Kaiserbacteria bacterium]|nr:DUF3137 domain-containing protein [Candidatus Kaiserbacteria bacterium]
MSRLREQIPTVDALSARLEKVLAADLANFLRATRDRREQVRANIRYVITAGLFLIALFVFLFITSLNFTAGEWKFRIVTMLALLWSVVLLVYGRSWFLNAQLLAREMNMALASVFGNVFDYSFVYTHNTDIKRQVTEHLKRSALLTADDLVVHTDDSYQIYGDTQTTLYELLLTKQILQKQGIEYEEMEVFRGLFVVTALSTIHAAETYISTEGDTHGFAHRTFWTDLFESGTVKETQLEWNEFEADLHVASSDGTVAREVLTPAFMQDLHSWWLEHKLHFRIAIKQNELFLLIPESTIQIASSTTSTDLNVIKRYAETLARPIWRSLLLVEDVSR